jgi:hypothetical protein
MERVPTRVLTVREPRVWFALAIGDIPQVGAGDQLGVDDPLAIRLRHPTVAEASLHGPVAPEPGTRFEAGEALAGHGRNAIRFEGSGCVLYRTSAGRVRAAVSRHQDSLLSPVGGTIEIVEASGIRLRADGNGLRGVMALGEPSHGRLLVAVEGPEAELRASQVDVSQAGSILLAGSRVDVEALTRARAMGVHGMITGGMIGKDLRDLAASLARQEAALHASPPFALLVMDGYGKRPIPELVWECLVEAAGRDVAITVDPPMAILDAGQTIPSRHPDHVRLVSEEGNGRTGRVLQLAGLRRRAGGIPMECARVALAPLAQGDEAEIVEVPLADLERDV